MLKNIITIKGYDVTVLKLQLGEGHWSSEWYCAYVKLKGKLKEDYSYETFRENQVIGIDTNHSCNREHSLEEKYKDCLRQIREVIKEHTNK